MRSFGNNVALTASVNAVREQGSDGMANTCELLINVVIVDKPKTLTGLNQKVRGQA